MDEFRPELLVALGDDGGLGAVGWAVARARRSGLDLRLVHVVPPRQGLAGPENLLVTFDAVELVGSQIVRTAVERVEALAGGELTVNTGVPTGHPVAVLARLATGGCAAVVMQHRTDRSDGHLHGSVAAGVASRVTTPVISVPDTWTARPAGGTDPAGGRRHVTIGVADPDDAEELIEHALVAAALEPGSCLTLLHAWHVPATYELGLLPPDFETGWVEQEARALNELAVRWQRKLADMEVETRLEHGSAESVLVQASSNSDLLILGRTHQHPVRHVGPVAAALLRRSECPVEIVPTRIGSRQARDARS
jgi:nucleotide-binding universal stress UspA family protein